MIYFAQSTDGGAVKIGFSADVHRRLGELESYYGCDLVLLATMEGGRAEEAEIHARFRRLRFGRTEQFRPGADLMAFIGRSVLVGANPDAFEVMMAEKKPPTLSVKLRMGVIESARVVAALRGVTITDLISDMIEEDLKRMEQEEIDKRAKSARKGTR